MLKRACKFTALQQAKITSASRLSTLGEMAGGIAHEINNPLTIIQGAAALLRNSLNKGTVDMEMMRKYLERIEQTSMRMSKIIQGLRVFARDGEKEPFRQECLKTIVDDSIGLCSEKFRNNNIELIVDDIDPGLMIECRGTQISQVILNLLQNAFDAVASLEHKWVRVEGKAKEQ